MEHLVLVFLWLALPTYTSLTLGDGRHGGVFTAG